LNPDAPDSYISYHSGVLVSSRMRIDADECPPQPHLNWTKVEGMTANREILTALLREASRQSEPFQSLIHDYSADVMNDSEVHRLFTARLDANAPMRREIEILKASLRVPAAGPLSPAMNEVLAAADALPAGSHASLCEIADLVAVELVYTLREMTPAR